jgi:hypothetical protein
LDGDTSAAAEPTAGLEAESGPQPAHPPANPESAAAKIPSIQWQNELEFLRQEVETAREQRLQLETELAALAERVDNLGNADDNPIDDPHNADSDNALLPGTAQFEAARDAAHRASFGESAANDERSSLLAAGLDAQTARDLQSRADRNQLARLDLIDQATREGWRDSEQFEERIEELDANRVDYRSELGDDGYDRYLYEAGRNNRVAVASVISGSAAEAAGLDVGDVVLSYANQRIFTTTDLQKATREGSRGESVQVAARRGGELLALDIPRGPLGVTLIGVRSSP